MPRLFLGNFDFEHRLADSVRQLPAKLERINAELATSWLAIADDRDYLWTPQPIDASVFEQAARGGLPRVIPVVSLDDVPRGSECVPWGWTDDIRRLCDKYGWLRNDPPPEAVRMGNSRRFSADLEQEWHVGLAGATEVPQSFTAADAALSRLGPGAHWVMKAEFGMSGRERFLGEGPLTDAARNWLCKRFPLGRVFLEPWVERLDEVGIQIDIPREGEPQLLGVVPMLVDERGQYTGSWFATDKNLAEWNTAVEVAMKGAARLQQLGYFGPVGIDAMKYRMNDSEIRFRPLQDINARWTMGRLSLGWRRLLQPGEAGCWQHGTHHEAAFDGRDVARVIHTSAELVGGIASHHASRVVSIRRDEESEET